MKIIQTAALCALLSLPAAFAAEMPKAQPALMTLSEMAAKSLAGGYLYVEAGEAGRKTTQSVILKPDLTFENFINAEAGGVPPISAYGGGVWFARIAADGAIEIALGRNKDDTAPEWTMKVLADGNLLNGDKIWARGK